MSVRDACIVRMTTKDIKTACVGCGTLLYAEFGHQFCETCWTVERVCRAERVVDLQELGTTSTVATLWRVADLLRRTGADDADLLIRRLERLTA